MFQTAEQQKINSQLKQKLQNAQGGEIIPINYEAHANIQDQVKLHNYAAYCIQLKAAKYNDNCRKERKENRDFLEQYNNLIKQLSFSRKKY